MFPFQTLPRNVLNVLSEILLIHQILAIKNYWDIKPVWICSQSVLMFHHIHLNEITSRNSLQGSLLCACVLGVQSCSLVLSIWQLSQDALGERELQSCGCSGAQSSGVLLTEETEILGQPMKAPSGWVRDFPLCSKVTKRWLFRGLCELCHEILSEK